MLNEYFFVLKAEWMLIAIIFLLLFLKVGTSDWKNETLLYGINILLLVNLLVGFFSNLEGGLFSGMFHNDALLILEKNILNLGDRKSVV